MFLVHFYVVNNEQNIWESLKKLIVQNVQQLFELEGIYKSAREL
jgi:hypothetical protein